MPLIGDPILYRDGTSSYHLGFIAGNIDGTTADLVVGSNGDVWVETNALPDNTHYMRYGKAMGTGIGQWQPNPAGTGPQGPAGPAGDTGATGPQGPAGAGFTTIAENTPSRSLGTAFQVSTTSPALVHYSVRVESTLTLTGGASGRIELVTGPTSSPTACRGRVAGGATGALTVGVSVVDVAEGTLTYLVPAGHWVLIRGVAEAGSPVFALTGAVEQIL